MPVLSHLHQLFNAEQCQAYIHTLRWKERPLQCPRCQSHRVGRWGTYHYRPGCKRYWCHSCKRTFNDLTETLLHQSKRPLVYWIRATFLLCLACSSRRIAREAGVLISAPVIGGAGGCAMLLCPMKWSVNWQGPSKRMISTTPLARRGKPSRVGRRRWDVERGGAARNVSLVGAIMTKTGPRLLPGSVARGLSSSRRPKISP